MNELTKKMQEIMVPKAALIAYEYRESAYATGKNYLELRPINKAGRMEAGIPVTYEFMNWLTMSLPRLMLLHSKSTLSTLTKLV